jgi:hypothetical protein
MKDPFAKTLSELVTGRLDNAGSGRSRPQATRWTWLKRKLRTGRFTMALQHATPVTVNRYRQAAGTVRLMVQNLRRTRRRQVFMLWSRLVLASLIAVLWRFRWVFAGIVVLVGLAAALVYAWPYLASLLPAEPATPVVPGDGPDVQP